MFKQSTAIERDEIWKHVQRKANTFNKKSVKIDFIHNIMNDIPNTITYFFNYVNIA